MHLTTNNTAKMRLIKLILTASVSLAAYLGDYIVFNSKYSSSHIFRAFADNSVHAGLGCLSSAVFFSHENNISVHASLSNIIFCTLISSLIDIDHIIAARSFYFKDFTSLKQQGIFHCSTLWAFATSLLLVYSYSTKRLNIFLLTFMLIIAYTSHHVRDANRRGLWLYPFGHTAPFNKHLYILILATLPHILAYIYSEFKKDFYRNVIISYTKLSVKLPVRTVCPL